MWRLPPTQDFKCNKNSNLRFSLSHHRIALSEERRAGIGTITRVLGRLIHAGDVRFGSLADIGLRLDDVRFTPQSGHSQRQSQCPLSANSGHFP
jgi:hypothetical protein